MSIASKIFNIYSMCIYHTYIQHQDSFVLGLSNARRPDFVHWDPLASSEAAQNNSNPSQNNIFN